MTQCFICCLLLIQISPYYRRFLFWNHNRWYLLSFVRDWVGLGWNWRRGRGLFLDLIFVIAAFGDYVATTDSRRSSGIWITSDDFGFLKEMSPYFFFLSLGIGAGDFDFKISVGVILMFRSISVRVPISWFRSFVEQLQLNSTSASEAILQSKTLKADLFDWRSIWNSKQSSSEKALCCTESWIASNSRFISYWSFP